MKSLYFFYKILTKYSIYIYIYKKRVNQKKRHKLNKKKKNKSKRPILFEKKYIINALTVIRI